MSSIGRSSSGDTIAATFAASLGLSQQQPPPTQPSDAVLSPISPTSPSWIIPPEHKTVWTETPLGVAGSDSTSKGVWNNLVVAIKKLPRENTRQACIISLAIVEHVQRFQHLRHANVLQILGESSNGGDPPYLITPYLANGNILQFLRENPTVLRPKSVYEISLGMDYLHSLDIVHGRLKTSNIVVTDNGQACITDYGLYQLNNMPASDARYLSPEAWKGKASKPSDVFAFAMTTFEVLSSNPPWGFLSDTRIYQLVVREGERPDRPEPDSTFTIQDRDWSVLQDSWRDDPKQRLTFPQIVARIAAADGDEATIAVEQHQGQTTVTPEPMPATSSTQVTSFSSWKARQAAQADEMFDTSLMQNAPPAYAPSASPTQQYRFSMASSYTASSSSPPVSRSNTLAAIDSGRQRMTPPLASMDLQRPTPSRQFSTTISSNNEITYQPQQGYHPRSSTSSHFPTQRQGPLTPATPSAYSTAASSRTSSIYSYPESWVSSPTVNTNQFGQFIPPQGDQFGRREQDIPIEEPRPYMLDAAGGTFPLAAMRGVGSIGGADLVRTGTTISAGSAGFSRWGGSAVYQPLMSPERPGSVLSSSTDSRTGPIPPSRPSPVIITGALHSEINEGRKREVIDKYLIMTLQMVSEAESEKEAQKFITAGIIPTLISLLKSRAVDGIGLEIVLKTLGMMAHDPLSANTIVRTSTTTTLLEIVDTSNNQNAVALAIWCISRISRNAELAGGLVKSDVLNLLMTRGLNGAAPTSQVAAWCVGNLIYSDNLADTLAGQGVVQPLIDNLRRSLSTYPENIPSAIYPIARISRSIKLAKQLTKAGCIEPLIRCLRSSESPDVLMFSARAVGCLMRPNSADMAKALLDAGAAHGLARLPTVLPTEAILPLEAFAFAIQRFSCAEWGSGTRKALVDAGVVDSLLAALRTAADVPYPKVHSELALAVSFLGDVGGGELRKEIVRAGGIDILKRVGANAKSDRGDKEVAKACSLAVTSITGNLWTRNAASAKTAMLHDWSGGCPDYQPGCPQLMPNLTDVVSM
ncbi:hypothetical protein FRB99_003520 [Tulasnella sp. 403]|nr:hypothetical protein FRB99_003520 [Tulasnella sp. 403]